jgi:hypothetical protein
VLAPFLLDPFPSGVPAPTVTERLSPLFDTEATVVGGAVVTVEPPDPPETYSARACADAERQIATTATAKTTLRGMC